MIDVKIEKGNSNFNIKIKENFDLSENIWHLDENAEIDLKNIYTFPYSIVEIKLQNGTPEYLNPYMSYLNEVHKFSKFGCGCCIFFPEKIVLNGFSTPQ